MWYSKEKLDENKRKRELHRQAIERRLQTTTSAKKKAKKKVDKEEEEILRSRKETGFLGEMA